MNESYRIIEKQGKVNLFELPNKLRLAYSQKPGLLNVYCGIMINTGSKDEHNGINGISHFIEHTIFKKTKKRTAYQILSRLESVGGEINAYTTRENTCYYAVAEKKYFNRVMELLQDLVYQSQFPENELEKEKGVIEEEIEMYLDNPDETIHDHFHAEIFGSHPLGLPILGTRDSLRKISRNDIISYLRKNYSTENTIISVCGSMNPQRFIDTACKYFSEIPSSTYSKENHSGLNLKSGFNKSLEKDYQQVHCVIGVPAFPVYNEQKYPLIVLNNLLGGDWMSSRLFMSVREKHGLVYNINTSLNLYQAAGLYLIHFATDKSKLDKAMKLVNKEIERIKTARVSRHELNRTKRQIMGQYSIMAENNLWLMLNQAKSVLNYNKVTDRDQYFSKIEHVSEEDISNLANKYLSSDKLCTLIYQNP